MIAIALLCYSTARVFQYDAYRTMHFAVRISIMAILLKVLAWVFIVGAVGYLFGGRRGLTLGSTITIFASPAIAFLYVFFHDISQNVNP